MDTGDLRKKPSSLVGLPPEIIHEIFSHLKWHALVSLSRTCRLLRKHAENELLWAKLIREYLPNPPDSAFPSTSFRSLYISHHPYWFLPKHKIWFSDHAHTGKLIVVKYDPRRGSIEGYRLLGSKGESAFQEWSYNQDVIIQSFEPTATLHHDCPVIKLDHSDPTSHPRRGEEGEVPMKVGNDVHESVFSTFFLSRKQPQDPSVEMWPPQTIPSDERVRSASQDDFHGWEQKPQKYDEISDKTFRLRTWMQFSVGGPAFGVRMGEEVSTWSTLDPTLYTPTKEKPYQGIWMGDYSGHGCEFILVTQRPTVRDECYTGQGRSWSRSDSDLHDDEEDLRVVMANAHHGGGSILHEDAMYTGRIEAIKLTGDVNVPRGEYTWIANDIGPAGFVRVAEEEPFQGARIVRSRGHLSARGFQNAEFVPTQLIMISHNRLAQYWIPLGHVSYYERVDIEALMGRERKRWRN